MSLDKIVIHYNTAGHPLEWTIHLPGYDHEEYIPAWVGSLLERRLRSQLGESVSVSNRGSRLEVNSALFTGDGDQFAGTIQDAVVASVPYDVVPDVKMELVPCTPPAPVNRSCRYCGVDDFANLREVLAHMRSAHATESAGAAAQAQEQRRARRQAAVAV